MPKKQHSELVAGIFVLAALAAGLGALLWIGAAGLFTRGGARLYFAVPITGGSTGLAVGSNVKFNDAYAGRITEIYFDSQGQQTVYVSTFEYKGLAVHADAKAQVASEFVGGSSIIFKGVGTAGAPLVDAVHPIILDKSQFQTILDRIDEMSLTIKFQVDPKNPEGFVNRINTLTGTLGVVSQRVDNELNDARPDSLMTKVKATADNLQNETNAKRPDSLMAGLHRGVDELNGAKAGTLMGSVKSAAENIQKETSATQPGSLAGKIHRGADDLDATLAKIREYTDKDLADLLTRFRKIEETVQAVAENLNTASVSGRDFVVLNRNRLDQAVADLASMSANLDAAAKEIRRNPWRLMAKPSVEDVKSQNFYDAARAFTEGASQLDDALARLEALRKLKPEGVSAEDPELAKIRAALKTSLERFKTVEDALWKEAGGK